MIFEYIQIMIHGRPNSSLNEHISSQKIGLQKVNKIEGEKWKIMAELLRNQAYKIIATHNKTNKQ